MKLKQLVSLLQQVQPFEKPKILLEQYPTSAQIASEMIYAIANQDQSIQGSVVMDLGVGTGMLSAGAIAYEPELLIGVDIDADALHLCAKNIHDLFVDDGDEDEDEEEDEEEEEEDINQDEVKKTNAQPPPVHKPNFELVMADVKNLHSFTRFKGLVDTVLMNPPFGTKKNAGIDMIFLERAVQIANKVVYSLHKTSTRSHILRKIQEWGHQGEVMAQLRFDIPAMYRFHREKCKDIEVDLIKIVIKRKPGIKSSPSVR